MNSNYEISTMSATELRDSIAKKELSPVEVVEAALDQIENYNDSINAVVTISGQAIDDAKILEKKLAQGKEAGILCGLPTGIKDITPVANMRTTYGSPLYTDNISQKDALVVQRLRKAGAVIIGKTNTPEFGVGGNTFNEVFGATCNPWNINLSAGGSTGGGAAALASGMIALAEGTDLGGSLRIPASFCGVVGLRPSPGLAPTYPSDYLWDTLQVTGPMARTAEDVALMLQAISGPSSLCPVSQPATGRDFIKAVKNGIPKGTKIAYAPDIAGIGVEAEIEHICRITALEMSQSGAIVEEINLDLTFAWISFLAIRGYWMVAQQYRRLNEIDKLSPNLKGNVENGLAAFPEQLGKAEAVRGQLWEMFTGFFKKYDYLLTPCMAISPFPVKQNFPTSIAGRAMATYVDWIAPTFILSLLGLPVGCVPAGLTKDKLPVGLQILGKPHGEEAVLALAKQLQEAAAVGLPDLSGLI